MTSRQRHRSQFQIPDAPKPTSSNAKSDLLFLVPHRGRELERQGFPLMVPCASLSCRRPPEFLPGPEAQVWAALDVQSPPLGEGAESQAPKLVPGLAGDGFGDR